MTLSHFASSAKRALRLCKPIHINTRRRPWHPTCGLSWPHAADTPRIELALGVRGAVCQYVILGAGLDTFAYRNPYPQGTLHVFEVDQPATQTWKRARLDEMGMTPPGDLTFAPVDFETRTLADGLRGAGYDPGKGTFFSWLGVTEYLTTEAVMTTLRFIASASKGSGIVFDYMISPSLLTPVQRDTVRYPCPTGRVGRGAVESILRPGVAGE